LFPFFNSLNLKKVAFTTEKQPLGPSRGRPRSRGGNFDDEEDQEEKEEDGEQEEPESDQGSGKKKLRSQDPRKRERESGREAKEEREEEGEEIEGRKTRKKPRLSFDERLIGNDFITGEDFIGVLDLYEDDLQGLIEEEPDDDSEGDYRPRSRRRRRRRGQTNSSLSFSSSSSQQGSRRRGGGEVKVVGSEEKKGGRRERRERKVEREGFPESPLSGAFPEEMLELEVAPEKRKPGRPKKDYGSKRGSGEFEEVDLMISGEEVEEAEVDERKGERGGWKRDKEKEKEKERERVPRETVKRRSADGQSKNISGRFSPFHFPFPLSSFSSHFLIHF
jgi:hypothetical protein